MHVKRNYQSARINWVLIPDLLDRVEVSIPEEALQDGHNKLMAVRSFYVKTYSQTVEFDAADDFLHFIRNSQETPDGVIVRIRRYVAPSTMAPYNSGEPFFEFDWDHDRACGSWDFRLGDKRRTDIRKRWFLSAFPIRT